MLLQRCDKYKLSIVLSIIFCNLNFFTFRKNGTIIAKRKWYSLKRAKFDLNELATIEIPTLLAKSSEKAAAHYSNQIAAEFNTPNSTTSDLITAIHQHVTLNSHNFGSKFEKELKYPFKCIKSFKGLKMPKIAVPKIPWKAKTVEEQKEPVGYVIVGKIYNTLDSTLNEKYRQIVRHIQVMENRYCLA